MDCIVMDLGYLGTHFTWNNRREGEGLICERLNRFVGNGGWCSLFPGHKVSHDTIAYFDHFPILLNTRGRTYTKQ